MEIIHRWRVTVRKFENIESLNKLYTRYRCMGKSIEQADRIIRDGCAVRIHYFDAEPSSTEIQNLLIEWAKECPKDSYKFKATKEEIWETVHEKFAPA